jgi:hypothetical protein
MATWREIDRIRKDAEGFRSLANWLLKTFPELTEWEKDFLMSVQELDKKKKEKTDEFTTRQGEKLLQIRDDNESVIKLPGDFSASIILRKCKEAKLDLSEEDEKFIDERCASGEVRRKHVGRLMRCARQLDLIESELYYND